MKEVSFLGKFLSNFASTVVIVVLGSVFIAGLVLIITITSNPPFWFFILLILGISFITSLVGTWIEQIRSEKEKLNDRVKL